MADRSTHYAEPFLQGVFHPHDAPKGMNNYNLDYLTGNQQQSLNNHKLEIIRDNQKYLYKNPEVRAILQVIMRKLLIERPSHDIERFIGKYFCQEWDAINEEVNKYLETCTGLSSEDDSKTQEKEDKHVKMDERILDYSTSMSSGTSAAQFIIKDLMELQFIITDIMDDILNRVHELNMQHIKADVPDAIKDDRLIGLPQTLKAAEEDDDDVIFDLGLDFDLDFSAYHEVDDSSI